MLPPAHAFINESARLRRRNQFRMALAAIASLAFRFHRHTAPSSYALQRKPGRFFLSISTKISPLQSLDSSILAGLWIRIMAST
jgi:hypothetical protein